MARYNSVNSTNSVGAGSTISSPFSGLLTTIPSAGTVTIPNPVLYTGTTQTFYNAGVSGNVILTTPSGVFNGPGAGGTSSFTLPFGSIVTLVSDGTNYITQDWLGGTVSTANLVATGGTINGINIGATTTGTGAFSSLSTSGTLSTTATTAATLGTTGTGALQVSGGASVAGIFNVGGKTYHADSVGIGTNNPGANLEVSGATGQNIYVSYVSGSQLRLKSDSGDSGVGTTGSTPLLFLINNAEKARIDTSGNVGIGTG